MWDWLIKPETPYTWGFIFRVFIKAVVLFIIANLLFAWLQPMDTLGRLSLYNILFAGRERLPVAGQWQAESYVVSTDNIPAMFASHQIARPKADDEFRVIILSNSAIWGYLLQSHETLSPQMNAMNYHLADGRRVVTYNLSHPFPYSVRDLIFLDELMQYHQPDMIIWIITAATLWKEDFQFESTTALNNPERIYELVNQYNLQVNTRYTTDTSSFWERTIIGQRREIADLIRLQLYGFIWQATRIDHFAHPNDLRLNDLVHRGPLDRVFTRDDFFFDVLDVGYRIADDVPIILVNQPMFVATGLNSEFWYNLDYPRVLFDSYRRYMAELATENNWLYCDLWDLLPNEAFTDTAFHITPQATGDLGRVLNNMITHYMAFQELAIECE